MLHVPCSSLQFPAPHVFLHLVQDPRVLDAMLPYMTCFYGNPHSRTHAYGWESEAATEKARQVGWLVATT